MTRLKKDLTERETWYKEPTNGDNRDLPSSPEAKETTYPSRKTTTSAPRSWRRKSKRLERIGKKPVVKSVIFVPHTNNSEFAKILRDR